MNLLCTVRDCRAPLAIDARRAVCERGHSFDIARSGYLNLLQPQDRRSRVPGDSPEAAAARRRFLDRGFVQPIRDAIVAFMQPVRGPVLDAGCGEGYHLGSIDADERHGVDISVAAIDEAAKRYPSCHWIVANADRFLPYADASFAIVMSITARLNPPEFRRVLRDDGRLVIAIPGADDLVELRGMTRDRVSRTVEMFAEHFTLARHEHVRHVVELDESAVEDLLKTTYRRVKVRAGTVTMSRDLLLFEGTGGAPPAAQVPRLRSG
ncbi:MAG TPA: methyltransferase domain-containing protein [Thermoanaerobaculia bacterium]|nr:methyltransferase domain-containing protein [Thermoanaerobaculia bacterium]